MKYYLSFIAAILMASLQTRICAQSCTISCPSNLIVMADSSKEGAIVNFPKATTVGECGAVTYTPASGTFFRLGSHTVIAATATGPKCSFTITVTDNEPPKLSPITLSSKRLWPASNKMKRVGVFYNSSDNGEEVKTDLAVTSNEPNPGAKDWEIIDNHMVRLKASRLSNGDPRIYFITVTVTDDAGNLTRRTTSIAVSKTMVARTIAKENSK